MIQSLFIISADSGDVVLEKHYQSFTSRSSVELFTEQALKTAKRDDVPPIITTAKYHLVNIYRNGLYILATVTGEMPPLFVLEFLHRVFDIFTDYFGDVNVRTLTDNFSTAYQLLEEMLDNGYPCITEPNALNTLIAPPSIVGRMANFVLGKASNVSETLGEGAMSIIPWRRAGVKYTQNEIFFDIIEEIDMIVESNGSVVSSDLRGFVTCNSRMSGTPDLTLQFNQPAVIEDCSFHPCVRYGRWEREQVVSFVPPDGSFTLMNYRAAERTLSAPLYCRPTVSWREGSAKVSFVLGTKPMAATGGSAMRTSSGGISSNAMAALGGGGAGAESSVEDIRVVVSFPASIKSVDLTPDAGSISTDPRTNAVTWHLSRMPRDKMPELSGTVYLPPGAPCPPIESIHATLSFGIPNASVSGLGVRDLLLASETYKFFKGVRTAVKAGRITIRT